ncbi:hypothetical protein PT974_05536 [Cladobotryum mycophilum]|uniref:Uncharacterized protein n=1 Tax=Cladobotryum mycophilum TaxID=491253 RepID=A0ABR0SK81_9HYPO
MPEIYTPIPDDSYLLGRTFYKPTAHGHLWAIALKSKHGFILTSATSAALAFIFARIWRLICSPSDALELQRPPLCASGVVEKHFSLLRAFLGDFAYAILFCALACIIYGGGISLSIIAPSRLQLGNVAPVRPSILYYPDPPDDRNDAEMLQWYSLVSAENLRALGSVDAAKSETRKRVTITTNKTGYYKDNGTFGLNYTYSITGVDLGLQHGNGLLLNVSGSCRTEYDWLVSKTAAEDIYYLWNNETMEQRVPIDNLTILNTPNAIFIKRPEPWLLEPKDTGNTSFAIIVTSAYRASLKPGSDPWYKTEPLNSTTGTPYSGVSFRIQRGRPVLSCWQHDQWSYGTRNRTYVSDVTELGEIPDIKIKPALIHVLRTVFDIPVLVNLGIASGDSALKPGIKSLDRKADFIDAETSRIEYDMERLLFASFIKSKNALVDTTMFESRGPLKNIMGYSRSEPLPGVGDFVISSSKIQTFSMLGLIVLLVVLLVLLAIEDPETLFMSNADNDARPIGSGVLALSKALSASQLFYRIHEPEENRSQKECKCARRFTEASDGQDFGVLEGCSQDELKGQARRPSRV